MNWAPTSWCPCSSGRKYRTRIGNIPYVTTYGRSRVQTLTNVTIDALSIGGNDELGFGLYGQLDQAADATITLGCGGKTIVITVDATSEEATIGPVL